MHDTVLSLEYDGQKHIRCTAVHTLVVGSGAAGLNAAVQLRRHGVEDVLIVTEGLHLGTSINTGSDKQTYYKLSLCGPEPDSIVMLAETLFSGGSMHGDLALVEAALSARAFYNLVNLGVAFPQDSFGQFPGYKTDHDPRQRATSIGPYTSREMCLALQSEVARLGIPVREGRNVVELLTSTSEGTIRVVGAVAVCDDGEMEIYVAENVVFAVGGFGGLFERSVYPAVHNGAIGVALMAGALAQNLPEMQFGLASTKFRWNVSGTYMQVVPRIISSEADGESNPVEFLRPYFESVGEMCSRVFLKGYQWPFDARKVIGGSSLIDVLVFIETVLKGRRVFLDYRSNPEGFRFEELSSEAYQYLQKSGALQARPIERLLHMNPQAVELYRDHGIDLEHEPLEVAVCAQHNNGGLAGNRWWESVNIKHLFPVGEVNGSHGVYRPGGSALNAGQVGGIRAAQYIAHRYADWSLDLESVQQQGLRSVRAILDWLRCCGEASSSWQEELVQLRRRMSEAAGPVRRQDVLTAAAKEAREQFQRIAATGCGFSGVEQRTWALRTRQLCFAHAVYLEAIRFAVSSGVGSRGSAIVLAEDGQRIHPGLDKSWSLVPEDPEFQHLVLETVPRPDGSAENRWVQRRPIPMSDIWFETAWARWRKGEIYDTEGG